MDTSITPPPAPLKTEEKLLIVLCHLSVLLGVGLVLPLVVYLVKKDDSSAIAFHAKEALNFHISLYLYSLICVLLVLVLIGFPLLIILGISALVLSILAAIRGAEGREYRYPLTIRLVS